MPNDRKLRIFIQRGKVKRKYVLVSPPFPEKGDNYRPKPKTKAQRKRARNNVSGAGQKGVSVMSYLPSRAELEAALKTAKKATPGTPGPVGNAGWYIAALPEDGRWPVYRDGAESVEELCSFERQEDALFVAESKRLLVPLLEYVLAITECPECHGRGIAFDGSPVDEVCERCGGSGSVDVEKRIAELEQRVGSAFMSGAETHAVDLEKELADLREKAQALCLAEIHGSEYARVLARKALEAALGPETPIIVELLKVSNEDARNMILALFQEHPKRHTFYDTISAELRLPLERVVEVCDTLESEGLIGEAALGPETGGKEKE